MLLAVVVGWHSTTAKSYLVQGRRRAALEPYYLGSAGRHFAYIRVGVGFDVIVFRRCSREDTKGVLMLNGVDLQLCPPMLRKFDALSTQSYSC